MYIFMYLYESMCLFVVVHVTVIWIWGLSVKNMMILPRLNKNIKNTHLDLMYFGAQYSDNTIVFYSISMIGRLQQPNM